ncbi:MAG: putative inner membrane transporter YedA [candidate division WS2 bacterium]|uniref:Inner membrane transporter YedA n=1 Tax=Psychracetigena formicireducens TaxID=2986056 RepID=A0A9E2BEU9_PSYF1|nr:putative inner membrane transporter YedA [Candidatus Psychracetigena formicireducens]MBT9144316.1 putative inner membrane transporter YedA [Candidatus Psychracetigena formicireducens]MBT9151040.1 putative inner membrane transporter YedA [Candidatus Psychracetigena formicireducens]
MIDNTPKKKFTSDLNRTGLFHLFVIYLVWSTTYLAIRIAVREGGGFPPFTFGAMRVLAAGAILIFWSWLNGKKLSLSRNDLVTLFISGLLLWVGGNGMVLWAQQRAYSGYAALIIGSTPIWVAIIESFIKKKLPQTALIIFILLGFGGIGILSIPSLLTGNIIDYYSIIALLIASISWGLGSILQKYRQVTTEPVISSTYQHLFGGIGFIFLALIVKEPLPSPTTEAWIAWVYLVIVGSIFAFTSFILALKLLPISLVMTYAYVNPVLALFLGWFFLKEPITPFTLIGALFIVLSVIGIYKYQYKTR